MNTTGIIQTIEPVIERGNMKKLYFTVSNSNSENLRLLLFNNIGLIEPYEIGSTITVLYNSKQSQYGIENYVNKIELPNSIPHLSDTIKTNYNPFSEDISESDKRNTLSLRLIHNIKREIENKKLPAHFTGNEFEVQNIFNNHLTISSDKIKDICAGIIETQMLSDSEKAFYRDLDKWIKSNLLKTN